MSILIVLALAAADAPPATNAAPPTADAAPICQEAQSRTVVSTARRGPHRLNEEPRAEAFRAVLRSVDGCSRPVKVRDDVPAR